MIKVVGIGLAGNNSIPLSSQKIIQQATILVGGKRHLNYFTDHPAQKLIINDFNELISEIKNYQNQQENIVILATGDPLFFGIGRILLTNFQGEELEFYPHLSCVQLAFNRLKIPWQSAEVISVHGRDIQDLIKVLKKSHDHIAILTDFQNNPLAIWQLLEQLKLPQNYDFFVCENLGSEEENIIKIKTKKEIENYNFSSLNIVILVRKFIEINQQLNLNNLPIIGIDDHLFASFADRPGLMTKREIRLMILGELSLQPQQIIWDIGAGTGSVSIEMARLTNNSQIYAIEKTAIGCSLIRENCTRFKVENITIIEQSILKIIDNLPNPDRIFIGGTGGDLTEILGIINKKIKPNGKLVIALATLENLTDSLNWFKQNNWSYQLLQLQINRSVAIANLTRLNPLNPVQIITAFPQL